MKVKAGAKAHAYRDLYFALLASNALSVLLFLFRVWDSNSYLYGFLLWNLFLAWVPLGFMLLLRRTLRQHRWKSLWPIVLTILWLGFLPNSFYMISDLIHLQPTGQISFLYDAVMFVGFIWNGLVPGFVSLYLMHRELLKRLGARVAHTGIAVVLLLCSFAIYLGRYLHWNSWDIILHPLGVIFDVSDSFINPVSSPHAVVTTLTFFGLLGVMYLVIWRLLQILHPQRRD